MPRARKPSDVPERRAFRRHARTRSRLRHLGLSAASLSLVSLSLLLVFPDYPASSRNPDPPHSPVSEQRSAFSPVKVKQRDDTLNVRRANHETYKKSADKKGAGDRFDAEVLRSRLMKVTRKYPGFYGIVIYDPASKKSVELNQDDYFTAASLAKLPVLLTLYREAARGAIDLDDEISILPTDVQDYGSGVLQNFPVGSTMTLRQCAKYLIKESDNTAWVMLERTLGQDRINATLTALGDRDADYGSYLMNPDDVLLSLKAVDSTKFTGPRLSGEMLGLMTDTAYEDRLPYPLPDGTRVAHKIGTYGDTFSDAGIVFYKDRTGKRRSYYVVVLSRGATEETARSAIREVSLDTYESFAKPSPKNRAHR
ncbi:MAG: serine hydrolase [Rubrobacteraceae bacterium]